MKHSFQLMGEGFKGLFAGKPAPARITTGPRDGVKCAGAGLPAKLLKPVLQDVTRQVFVLCQLTQVAVHIRRVDLNRRFVMGAGQVARTERHFFEQALEQGVQAAGTDVFGLLVDLVGNLGQALDAVGEELDVQPSVFSNAWYCSVSDACGSCRIRSKSSGVSAFSSTRIGRRPCSSGTRSLGLLKWNAPEAMNRM